MTELVPGIDRVLSQQVPDVEVLADGIVLERFGLSDPIDKLPDVLAYSATHNTLFFIQDGAINERRRSELERGSNTASCHIACVSVFASRKVYALHMDEQAADTIVWFADEPKHYVFISGSPEASEAFLTARFAARALDQR